MTEFEGLSFLNGIVGGVLVTVAVVSIIIGIISIIALWKLFTKAGEAGWKSLIPIYNVYILCKIVGINFWIFILAIPFGLGIVTAIINYENISTYIYGAYFFVYDIYFAIKLGRAFGKSNGFIAGLIFLPNIFELILGFDKSKYVGTNN